MAHHLDFEKPFSMEGNTLIDKIKIIASSRDIHDKKFQQDNAPDKPVIISLQIINR